MQFIEGNILNTCLEQLIRQADNYLFLVSPYIKLHKSLKDELKQKKHLPNLYLVVMFGKNESDPHKSLSKEDFEFLSSFPHVEIRYGPRLHAKYYASEDFALITSMNLHEYSQNNNIEAGVLIDVKNPLSRITSSLLNRGDAEQDAHSFFSSKIEHAELIFKRSPDFESVALGLGKKYIGSSIKKDNSEQFFKKHWGAINDHISVDYSRFQHKPAIDIGKNKMESNGAFCIRTGKSIPFNIKKPYCAEAYRTWSQFGNEEYPEKYCHFSGESSEGQTTFKGPILKKNWKKAKDVWKF